MERKRNIIRINEAQLHKMISESVRRVFNTINEAKQEWPHAFIRIDDDKFPKIFPNDMLISVCELVSDYMCLEASFDAGGDVNWGDISNKEEIMNVLQSPNYCEDYGIKPLSNEEVSLFMKALDKYLNNLDWNDFDWEFPYDDPNTDGWGYDDSDPERAERDYDW